MGMSKHTPGPWVQFDKNDTRTMILGPRQFHVASVPVFEEEDEANARLIVAAPDMLDALKALIACSEEPDPESLSPRAPLLVGAWAKARDAISKAEGRL